TDLRFPFLRVCFPGDSLPAVMKPQRKQRLPRSLQVEPFHVRRIFMKYLVPLCLVMLLALASAGVANAQNRPGVNKNEVLTNEAVINLSKAGFKERTIITLIRTSETKFDISTPKLVELKKRGVNEKVINEMIERTNYGAAAQRLTSLRDDEFFAKDDDAF